jgi:hypothetical protein
MTRNVCCTGAYLCDACRAKHARRRQPLGPPMPTVNYDYAQWEAEDCGTRPDASAEFVRNDTLSRLLGPGLGANTTLDDIIIMNEVDARPKNVRQDSGNQGTPLDSIERIASVPEYRSPPRFKTSAEVLAEMMEADDDDEDMAEIKQIVRRRIGVSSDSTPSSVYGGPGSPTMTTNEPLANLLGCGRFQLTAAQRADTIPTTNWDAEYELLSRMRDDERPRE